MSYFDDASLVMIPSGYKDQKVYSVKPTDGSGDLTFTRASNATRVASNGLIEKVRTNLNLYSQDFTNAHYNKANITVTGDSVANPLDGVVNADTIVASAGTTQKFIGPDTVFSGLYNYSVYVKYVSHQFVQLFIGSDASQYANFDIQNGVASAIGAATASIVSVGSGWYRLSMSFSTSVGVGIYLLNVDSLAAARFAATSSTGSYYAFGAQVEVGDIATDYIATTSAAVSVGPVSGLPRLDYLNSSCPRLLLEPQRTNLLTYSEQIDNANWGSFQSAAVTANTTISPDGYQNADTITFGSDPSSLIFQNYTSTSATFTISVYAKSSTGKKFCFRNFDGVGVVRSSDFTTTSSWQRFTFTFTSALANVAICNEVGGTVGSIDVWGAQLEAAAYATSYIPTLGTSATRVADACYKTGISSLIGQTEGTIFVEVVDAKRGASDLWIMESVVNDGNTGILVYADSSNSIAVFINATSSFFLNASVNIEQPMKIAVGYKAGSYALAVNGTVVATSSDAQAPPSGMNQFAFVKWLGSVNEEKQSVKQALLFKTRLTNAQLVELTTL